MTRPQSRSAAAYDLFKLIVALVLLAILIWLLLRACGAPARPLVTETPPAATTPPPSAQPTTPATAAVVAPQITSPLDGAQIIGSTLTVSGTGQPGSLLDFVDLGNVRDHVLVDSSGKWSLQTPLEVGPHEFVVRTADGSLSSKPVRITAAAPPTEQATPTASASAGCPTGPVVVSGYRKDKFHYVVGACDTLSSIAAALGIRLKDLLAANPQITNPDLIFPGQVINLP